MTGRWDRSKGLWARFRALGGQGQSPGLLPNQLVGLGCCPAAAYLVSDRASFRETDDRLLERQAGIYTARTGPKVVVEFRLSVSELPIGASRASENKR